ncbi:hypothetical protein [Streptomyces sp. NPDC015125]|uniref:hypothetical protein n=1 Tax=Streptomyces sp. NPDC015125 TaxID=3364938 RepID=UPI0036FC4DD0
MLLADLLPEAVRSRTTVHGGVHHRGTPEPGCAEQAALAWDHLTADGEERRDHPDYLPVWENPQRAEIRISL